MRTLFAALVALMTVTSLAGCESEERKKCNATCDEEAKKADRCNGPGGAECKAAIAAIVEECRTACKELVE